MMSHVEVGREARHSPIRELDSRNYKVGSLDMEGNTLFRHSIRIEHLAKTCHTAGWSKDGSQNGQRIHPDIEERPHCIEGARRGMPGFNASPVDLGIGQTYRSKPAITNSFPGRLLALTQ